LFTDACKHLGGAILFNGVSRYLFHMKIELRERDHNAIFDKFPVDDLPYFSFNFFNPENIITEEE